MNESFRDARDRSWSGSEAGGHKAQAYGAVHAALNAWIVRSLYCLETKKGARWAPLTESQRSGLNRRPLDYESSALPLSYAGETKDGRSKSMPWHGLEP